MKEYCNGVFSQSVPCFEKLCHAVRDLLWYMGPHDEKLKSRGASIPSFFSSVIVV